MTENELKELSIKYSELSKSVREKEERLKFGELKTLLVDHLSVNNDMRAMKIFKIKNKKDLNKFLEENPDLKIYMENILES